MTCTVKNFKFGNLNDEKISSVLKQNLFSPKDAEFSDNILKNVLQIQEKVVSYFEIFFDFKLEVEYLLYELGEEVYNLYNSNNVINVKDLGFTHRNLVATPLNRNLVTGKINPEIHETVHSFMDSIFHFEDEGRIPVWLYEGLSQLFDAYFKIIEGQVLDDYRFEIVKKLYSDINNQNIAEKISSTVQTFSFTDRYVHGTEEEFKGKLLLYHIKELDPKFNKFKCFLQDLRKNDGIISENLIFDLFAKYYGSEVKQIAKNIFCCVSN